MIFRPLRLLAILCRAGAAVLFVVALPLAFSMILALTGGRWEEGERLGFLDTLLIGVVPLICFAGLVVANWKPRAAIVVLGLSPLLLVETPVMYGAPGPGATLLFGAASLLHIAAWFAVRLRRT